MIEPGFMVLLENGWKMPKLYILLFILRSVLWARTLRFNSLQFYRNAYLELDRILSVPNLVVLGTRLAWYVTAALLDGFDKGFSLFAIWISFNMVKFTLFFVSLEIDWTHHLYKVIYHILWVRSFSAIRIWIFKSDYRFSVSFNKILK